MDDEEIDELAKKLVKEGEVKIDRITTADFNKLREKYREYRFKNDVFG